MVGPVGPVGPVGCKVFLKPPMVLKTNVGGGAALK